MATTQLIITQKLQMTLKKKKKKPFPLSREWWYRVIYVMSKLYGTASKSQTAQPLRNLVGRG